MSDQKKQAKVYEFKSRKNRRLKSIKYISPEKKELIRERGKAKKDRQNFYVGVAVLLLLVAILTYVQVS